MDWTWIVGIAALRAILLWGGLFESRKSARKPKRDEEEVRIDPAAAPEFKSTWQNMR
jgi:hypothetical protein